MDLQSRIQDRIRAREAERKKLAEPAPLLTQGQPAKDPIFGGPSPDPADVLGISEKAKIERILSGQAPDNISPVEIREKTDLRRGVESIPGLEWPYRAARAAGGMVKNDIVRPFVDIATKSLEGARDFDPGAAGLAGKMGYNLEAPDNTQAAQQLTTRRTQTPRELASNALAAGVNIVWPGAQEAVGKELLAELGRASLGSRVATSAITAGGMMGAHGAAEGALEPADSLLERAQNAIAGGARGVETGAITGAAFHFAAEGMPATAKLAARSARKAADRTSELLADFSLNPREMAGNRAIRSIMDGLEGDLELGLQAPKVKPPAMEGRRIDSAQDIRNTDLERFPLSAGERARVRRLAGTLPPRPVAREREGPGQSPEAWGVNPEGSGPTLRPESARPAPTDLPLSSDLASSPPAELAQTATRSPSTSQTPTIESRNSRSALESDIRSAPARDNGNVTVTPPEEQPRRFRKEDFPLADTKAGRQRLEIRRRYVKEEGVAPFDGRKDPVANFTNDPDELLPAVRQAHSAFIGRLRDTYAPMAKGRIIDPGMKPDASIIDKVRRKNGRFDVLGDLSRASIVVDRASDAHEMIRALDSDGLLAHVDDFNARPDGFGYGAIHLQLHDPATGIMHELQIHTPSTWRARSQLGGHDLYDRYAKDGGRVLNTPELVAQARREIDASRAVYNLAHSREGEKLAHELHYDPKDESWYVTKAGYYTRPAEAKVLERGISGDYEEALKYFADKYEPRMKKILAPEPEGRLRGVDGVEDEVIVHDKTFKTRYRIVEADDIIPSNNPAKGFERDPRYPAEIQGRSYHGATGQQARENVIRAAGEVNPRRLQDLGAGIGGPPVITHNGLVIIGNQRGMMSQIVASKGGPAYEGYLAELRKRAPRIGIDPAQLEGMKRPILVRELTDPEVNASDFNQLREINQLSDVPTGKAKDPLSEAFSRSRQMKAADSSLEHLARTLNPDETIRDYLSGPNGVELFKKLVADKVVLPQEMGRYVGVRGVTDEGKSAIEGLLQSAAIGNLDTIAAAPPAILRKLEHSFAPIVAAGKRSGWGLEDQLQGALDLLTAVKKNGSKNVADLLSQQDAFGRGWDEESIALASFIEKNKGANIATAARDYAAAAEAAERAGQAEDIFGSQPETPAEAFDRIFSGEEPRRLARAGMIGRNNESAGGMLGSIAGSGVGGAAGGIIGGQFGDTPEERRRNAEKGAALGFAAGAGAGFAGGRGAFRNVEPALEAASRVARKAGRGAREILESPGAETAIPKVAGIVTGLGDEGSAIASTAIAAARNPAAREAVVSAGKKAIDRVKGARAPEPEAKISTKATKNRLEIRIQGPPTPAQLSDLITQIRENPTGKIRYALRDAEGRGVGTGSSVSDLFSDMLWSENNAPLTAARVGAIGDQDLFGNATGPAQGSLLDEDAGRAAYAKMVQDGKAAAGGFAKAQEDARANADFLRKQLARITNPKARAKVAAQVAELERIAGFNDKISAQELSTRAAAEPARWNRSESDPYANVPDRGPEPELTPEAKRFVEGSAVKRRLFHGGDEGLDELSAGGAPFWATENANQAEIYTKGKRGAAQIYPLLMKIEKPLEIPLNMNDKTTVAEFEKLTGLKGIDIAESRPFGEVIPMSVWQIVHTGEFADAARAAGYDGLHAMESGNSTWASLYPEKVKSAMGNSGAFSSRSRRITGAIGDQPEIAYTEALAAPDRPGYDRLGNKKGQPGEYDGPEIQPTLKEGAVRDLGDGITITTRRAEPIYRHAILGRHESLAIYDINANGKQFVWGLRLEPRSGGKGDALYTAWVGADTETAAKMGQPHDSGAMLNQVGPGKMRKIIAAIQQDFPTASGIFGDRAGGRVPSMKLEPLAVAHPEEGWRLIPNPAERRQRLGNRAGAIGDQPADPRGPYLGETDLLNVSKIVEDHTARERIAQAAEKYRGQRDAGRKTWAETDPEIQKAVKELLANDPKARAPHIARKLTGVQLLARRDVIRQNDALIEDLSKKLASGTLTVAEHDQASQLMQKAVEHNDALLSDLITGASQKGRDLNLLKRISNKTLDHDVWQIQAKRMLGDRPLDDATAAQLRRLVNAAKEACE